MSHSRLRLLGIALGLLVVFLLLLANLPPEGETSVLQPTRPPTSPPVPSGKMSRESAPTGSTQPTGSDVQLLHGVVRTRRGEAVEDGLVLHFGAHDREIGIETPVRESAFSIPAAWEVSNPSPAEFEFRTLDRCPAPILGAAWREETLVLEVGEPRRLEVVVQDLSGQAIAEAEIQVFAPLPYREERLRADSDGRITVRTYSEDPRVAFRVTASGYEQSALSVNTSTTDEHLVQLSRLFGIGVVMKRSPALLDMGGVLPGDGVRSVVGALYRGIESRMRETHAALGEDELLFVSLVAETRWLDDPPVLQLSLAPRRRGVEFVRALNVELQALRDGLPAVVRVPDSAYPETEAVHEAVVRIGPRQAFLAAPPPSLFLRFVRSGVQEDPWDLRGTLVSDASYRFLLPEGDYELQAVVDDFDVYELAHPRLLPGTRLRVQSDSRNSAEVLLAPDERFVLIDCLDPVGRDSSIGALLAPADGKPRRFSPNSDEMPYGRFVRPGRWDLWFMNFDSLKPERLLEGLSWPAETTTDGRWILRIPKDHWSSTAFASRMR